MPVTKSKSRSGKKTSTKKSTSTKRTTTKRTTTKRTTTNRTSPKSTSSPKSLYTKYGTASNAKKAAALIAALGGAAAAYRSREAVAKYAADAKEAALRDRGFLSGLRSRLFGPKPAASASAASPDLA